MSILLITYDLHKKEPEDYQEFYDTIKNYSNVRLSESSYAIDTNDLPLNIYKKLKLLVDSSDKFSVLTVIKPCFTFGSDEVDNWFDRKELKPSKSVWGQL